MCAVYSTYKRRRQDIHWTVDLPVCDCASSYIKQIPPYSWNVMKVCTVILGVLVACAAAYAQANHGPVMVALQPQYHPADSRQVGMVEQPGRQKRSLLLGALGVGAIGAGIIGAGALGAGALVGAKAGFIGGALASKHFSGRSYGGGYGYGGYGHGYGGYSHGYGGYGHGYGHGYDDGYVVYEPTPVYGGYRSYPSYYVEDDWC